MQPALGEDGRRLHLARGPFGHYEGLALIFGVVAIVVLATVRFVRITRQLDDPEKHSASSVRVELILATGLVLLVSGYAASLALD